MRCILISLRPFSVERIHEARVTCNTLPGAQFNQTGTFVLCFAPDGATWAEQTAQEMVLTVSGGSEGCSALQFWHASSCASPALAPHSVRALVGTVFMRCFWCVDYR